MLEVIIIIQGVVICCLLSWEIYWLRRMYSTLNGTADKLERVVDGITKVVTQLKETSSPLAAIIKMFAPNGHVK